MRLRFEKLAELPPLAPGWSEVSGVSTPYWRNAETGLVTWSRPNAPAAPAVGVTSDAPLPSGWSQHYSAAKKRAYYRNTATGEGTWMRPAV